MSALSLSVVIPTYRRGESLERCLRGICRQTRPPEEVILVVRDDDEETGERAARFQTQLPLRTASVGQPGLVQALNAGLRAARGDVVSFTDDDAIPQPAWLATIEARFADPAVGGVGGPDVVRYGDQVITGAVDGFGVPLRRFRPWRSRVGRMQPFGRVTSNHHAPVPAACDVDVLKGVNMSYRRELITEIGFDPRVRGGGSQVHNELSVCLPLRAAGWRLRFDPGIVVDHLPTQRQHGDHREDVTKEKVYVATFNEELSTWPHIKPAWRPVHLLWAVLVGVFPSPGLAQIPRYYRRGQERPWSLMGAALRARWQAILVVSRAPRRRVPSPGSSR